MGITFVVLGVQAKGMVHVAFPALEPMTILFWLDIRTYVLNLIGPPKQLGI